MRQQARCHEDNAEGCDSRSMARDALRKGCHLNWHSSMGKVLSSSDVEARREEHSKRG